MDLLTVLAQEIRHLLGQEHEADSLMAAPLTVSTRHVPASDAYCSDQTTALDSVAGLAEYVAHPQSAG